MKSEIQIRTLQRLRRASVPVVTVATLSAVAGCGDNAGAGAEGSIARKPVSLAINGFNYTDTVISNFSVGGQGGGNIYVSSPTSGGSGTSCCVTWYPSTPLPTPVKIEWLRVVNGRDRWCEKTVQLIGPVPTHPTAFGVHFMPDGDVQVEVTQGYPELKLKLNNFDDGRRHETGNVIHDEEKARCRDGR